MRSGIAALTTIFFCLGFAQAGTIALNVAQKTSVQQWLNAHSGYRVATDEDCACSDFLPANLEHPYFLAANFRRKNQGDFAVVVVKQGRARPTAGLLLIFDGPLPRGEKAPTYVGRVAPIFGAGLFLSENGSVLGYGAYASDAICLYRPSRQTYRKDCPDTDYR